MKKVKYGKIIEIDFKTKEHLMSYTHDYQREEQLKVEFCQVLARACDLGKELYGSDKLWLDWFSRVIKQITYKVKEN